MRSSGVRETIRFLVQHSMVQVPWGAGWVLGVMWGGLVSKGAGDMGVYKPRYLGL